MMDISNLGCHFSPSISKSRAVLVPHQKGHNWLHERVVVGGGVSPHGPTITPLPTTTRHIGTRLFPKLMVISVLGDFKSSPAKSV